MQRVPFKNRLSWRQREKGRYFYTHSISKTARFPCCCDQVKEENNYKKSNLDRLRRNGQWRALTKREILIPKCSNQDEDDGMDRRLFFVYYFKGTYKTNKKKENQRRREKILHQRGFLISLRNQRSDPGKVLKRAKGVGIEARRRAWRAVTDTHTNTYLHKRRTHTHTLTSWTEPTKCSFFISLLPTMRKKRRSCWQEN